MTTLVIVRPLRSNIGLPSIDTLKSYVDKNGERVRVIIVDSEIRRPIARTLYSNPRYAGYEVAHNIMPPKRVGEVEVIDITSDPYLIAINQDTYQWNWEINQEDIRESDELVVYVDCTRDILIPSEHTMELVCMSLVEDFKTHNRVYTRFDNISDFSKVQSILNNPQKSYNIYSGAIMTSADRKHLVDIKVLVEALINYLENDLHKEEQPLPLYTQEVDIYNKPGSDEWPMNMHVPQLKGIACYYHIMPNVSKNDRWAMSSTGLNPTTLMGTSGQYRREITHTLAKLLANFIVNNNMHRGLNDDGTSLDWFNPTLWRNVLPALV